SSPVTRGGSASDPAQVLHTRQATDYTRARPGERLLFPGNQTHGATMERATRWLCVLAGGVLLFGANRASAQDWPQWRGPNRDAKAAGFKAPQTWPKELTQKWKTTVGEGVATPALVGDRLYVFTRQGGNEVVRALDAASGKEIWKYEYKAPQPQRPGAGFQNEFIGPRSSPTVADGKVLTIGVVGRLTCLDAASGKELWHKDEFRSYPKFY